MKLIFTLFLIFILTLRLSAQTNIYGLYVDKTINEQINIRPDHTYSIYREFIHEPGSYSDSGKWTTEMDTLFLFSEIRNTQKKYLLNYKFSLIKRGKKYCDTLDLAEITYSDTILAKNVFSRINDNEQLINSSFKKQKSYYNNDTIIITKSEHSFFFQHGRHAVNPDSTTLRETYNGTGYFIIKDQQGHVLRKGKFEKYKLVDGQIYIYNPEDHLVRISVYKDGK